MKRSVRCPGHRLSAITLNSMTHGSLGEALSRLSGVFVTMVFAEIAVVIVKVTITAENIFFLFA